MRTEKSMGIFSLFILSLIGSASAIVIVPPMVYFASISIAGFLANALISLGALAAVAGVANWKLFNSPMSAIISAIFGAASRLFLGIFTMMVALIMFFPISVQQIVFSAFAVLVMSAFLLFLRDYRLFRASQKTVKMRLLGTTAVFALFFAIVFVPSAYFSVEYRIISTQQETAVPTSASDQSISESFDQLPSLDLNGASKPAMAPSAQASADYLVAENSIVARQQQGDLVLWFLPQTNEDCIVEIEGMKEIFKPKRECKLQPNMFSEPQLCPISIQVPRQCQKDLSISASGSCSDSLVVKCKNNQLEIAN